MDIVMCAFPDNGFWSVFSIAVGIAAGIGAAKFVEGWR